MFFVGRALKLTCISFCFAAAPIMAQAFENQLLFSIDGKMYSRQELGPVEQGRLHELELNRFKTIESMARQRYVEEKTRGYEKYKTADKPFAAEEKWLKQSFEPSQAEIDKSLDKFKDEKQLQSLPLAEKNKVMRRYLEQQKRVQALTEATDKALQSGEIKLSLQAPVAPVISINKGSQASLGESNAPIRIVEFTDFQCPYCKKLAALTPEIFKKYGKSISWEVRHFPLSFHKQARSSAAAVYCASLQGKLAEAKKWVFESQDKLAQDTIFADMSQALSLKKKEFDDCRKADATEKVIQADVKEGERIGVAGTPMVFVNGRKFEGDVQSLEAWDTMIDAALNGSRKTPTL